MTPGTSIAGKYRLLRPLGKGSMGEVWAALHVDMEREVALKLIYPGDPDLAARLKREALACGRLEHPNIVRVYDIGETEDGDPFLVMELLSGETLAERLARLGHLPPEAAIGIAIDVARALRAAHGAGVIHRDLKPANVYLHRGPDDEAEVVKVLDFGVSKILSLGDMAFTVTGALVGSPAYMSPEQARASKRIDARADLWSLGVLLFEMLAGRRPFPASSPMGVVAEILSGPIPTLASALPGVDPRVDAAVARCLERDVDARMPSATALIDALRPALAEPPALRPAIGVLSDDQPTNVMDRSAILTAARPNVDVALDPDDADALPTLQPMPAPTRPFDPAINTMVVPAPSWPKAPPPAPPPPLPRGVGFTLKMPSPATIWPGLRNARDPRDTLPPGWEAHRRRGSMVLLIAAIAGITLALVVVVGISLAR